MCNTVMTEKCARKIVVMWWKIENKILRWKKGHRAIDSAKQSKRYGHCDNILQSQLACEEQKPSLAKAHALTVAEMPWFPYHFVWGTS